MNETTLSRLLSAALLVAACASVSFAANDYKPYLHKAEVPWGPPVKLFGQYATELFPGAATYTYGVDIPPGVGGLSPAVFVSYNSQYVKQRPGILGAGWSLNQDMIYRDVNGTPDSTSDDKFVLVLDSNIYQLVAVDGEYRTEVDYWFRIRNLGTYWLVTKQDGTQCRFGYATNASITATRGYTQKWLLDQVKDTHGNTISYSYASNPYPDDSGVSYLTAITYNSDARRVIAFSYETADRPDRRRVFDQGNEFEESRRLTDISVLVDGTLLKRHHFSYANLSFSLSALSNITAYGADNSSTQFSIAFSYAQPTSGFSSTTWWSSPVSLSDNTNADFGVRLVDVNNDGYTDIVQRKNGGSNLSYTNNKTNWTSSSSWFSPVDIVSNSGGDLGVRFEDVNRDGLVDVLVAKASSRSVYLNNGTGWVLSGWSLPVDFVDGSNVDQGVQVVDVNNDGFADLVKSRAGSRTAYLNTGSGWTSSSLSFPADFVDASGNDQGTRLADLNADGYVDVVQGLNKGSPTQTVWLSNGSGWVSSTSWVLPTGLYFTDSSPDTGTRIADLDGDGLPDITTYYVSGGTNTTGAWLNTGNGWVQSDSWLLPDAAVKNGNNTGRRLSDVNGDGFPDYIQSDDSGTNTYLKNNATPYLLTGITNEYGGNTTIVYTSSTQFNNTQNNVSQLGFNIFVVSNVTKDNGLTGLFNTVGTAAYNYSYGAYNYNRSEFRGFGLTTETTPTAVTQHYFLQDDARRGKEYELDAYSTTGSLLLRTTNDWNYTLASSIYNLSLVGQTSYAYDGLTDPRIINKSYRYNVYGNPQYTIDYGDVAVDGDERYYNYSYGTNTDDWIINKASRKTVYDANLRKVSETKYYYDSLGLNGVGSKGDLTKVERWTSDGNNTYTNYGYDPYGNQISMTDSLGNLYTYRYDALHVFREQTIDPLGHVTAYTYDSGTGNPLTRTQNGITTTYEYDTFGRITKEILPYDTEELPTKTYEYSFDGTAPEKIIVHAKTTANNTENAAFFYDGFGDVVQLKQHLEKGIEDVKNIFYDREFRVGAEQNPYFDNYAEDISAPSGSVPFTNYSYDALGRVVFVLNADGTNKTTTFSQYNITDADENGHSHVYTLDSFGRIVAVHEFSENALGGEDHFVTSYTYDGNDNLVGITDNEDNTFHFSYDALSRKTGMEDPDMGTWSYAYDANGNLINQTDARGESIGLAYDALNRVIRKTSSDLNVTYGYDGQYYGTLSNVSQRGADALSDVFYNYSYDGRLRLVNSTKNIADSTFVQTFLYDSQDRVISRNSLDYIYGLQGGVRSIPGYVSDASYNAFGSLASRTYDNGLVATYEYDTANNRLVSITIPSVQNLTYAYDSVGNILSISDGVTGTVSTMGYDSLNRLVNATIGPDRYVYGYNSIGNIMKIVKNDESKKFVYGGLAHAPSVVIEDGAGVDVVNPHDVPTGSKTRVVEFSLVSDRNESTAANFSADFGDGTVVESDSEVNVSTPVVVLLENSYAQGGSYAVTVNASANGSTDRESDSIKFGTRAQSLGVVSTNISLAYFEFIIANDVAEDVSNISWSCSDGLGSSFLVNLTGGSTVNDLLEYNYTSPGSRTFSCNATSLDGNESLSVVVSIPGLSIDEYDVLYENASSRIVAFDAHNSYYDLETNVSTETNGESASYLVNISSGATVFVVQATNYSSDGVQNFGVSLSGNGSSAAYNESFTLQGVSLENYARVDGNETNKVLLFDVVNNWNDGLVTWSVVNPSVNGSANLSFDERLAVVVENSYSQQDVQQVRVSAKTSVFQPLIADLFSVHPLELVSLQTLYEEFPSAAVELRVRNNLNASQLFSWNLSGPVTAVSSTNDTNISAGGDVFVIVYSGFNTGVTQTVGFVNSSSYSDAASGVVVVS